MASEIPGDARLARLVLQQLESFHRAGVTSLPRSFAPGRLEPAEMTELQETVASPEKAVPVVPGMTPGTPAVDEGRSPAEMPVLTDSDSSAEPSATGDAGELTDKQRELDVLRDEVRCCTRCPELAAGRTQTVFGVGNPHTRLCFFGEAPGADEDRAGEPFVGRAGQLLNQIIEACTLRREDVYILNTLRCRPPGNRNPLPVEVANCRPFFQRQLEIIQPEFICCLGAVAAQSLLETTLAVGKLRGRFHEFRGAKVLVTYHPAYLLRNPAAKRDTWHDMQMLMREMGIAIPDKKS